MRVPRRAMDSADRQLRKLCLTTLVEYRRNSVVPATESNIYGETDATTYSSYMLHAGLGPFMQDAHGSLFGQEITASHVATLYGGDLRGAGLATDMDSLERMTVDRIVWGGIVYRIIRAVPEGQDAATARFVVLGLRREGQ